MCIRDSHIDVLLAHESFKHSYNYDFMMKEQMKVSGNTAVSYTHLITEQT